MENQTLVITEYDDDGNAVNVEYSEVIDVTNMSREELEALLNGENN
jgi:hypothetical protein